MAHTSVRYTIPAPAADVWSLVGDVEEATDRWPAVARTELEGSGVGSLRTMHLVDGSVIRERLEAHDPKARRTRWEILDFSRLPLRELSYTVSVDDHGPKACDVAWELDFEAEGDSEEHVREMLEGIFGSIRASILESLEKG
jgi:ribosome-associated toxin RatA of RatAB toxin-antitoxin module